MFKSKKTIVIFKDHKINSIAILRKASYIEKVQDTMKGKEFKALNNNSLHKEREKEVSKYTQT